jgi:hypothetical protein
VSIDPAAEEVTEPEITRVMSRTRLANIVIPRPKSTQSGGMDYYHGSVFEQLQLEQLSHAALVVVCSELAVQVHLLVVGLMYAVAERYGEGAAMTVAEFQMAGSGWVVSERLKIWLGCDGEGIDDVISVLQVHPAFQPSEYWSIQLTRLDDTRALFELLDCPASAEDLPYGWHALLTRGMIGGLEGIVKGVDVRAQVVASEKSSLAWEIIIDGTNACSNRQRYGVVSNQTAGSHSIAAAVSANPCDITACNLVGWDLEGNICGQNRKRLAMKRMALFYAAMAALIGLVAMAALKARVSVLAKVPWL